MSCQDIKPKEGKPTIYSAKRLLCTLFLPDHPELQEFFAVEDVGDWDLGQHLRNNLPSAYENSVVGDSIRLLEEGRKLNDTNIDMYFKILSSDKRNPAGSDALFCTPWTYSLLEQEGVKKFASCIAKIRTPNFTRVFVPINIDSEPKHWFLISIDFEGRTILSMDSVYRVSRKVHRDTVMDWVKHEWNRSERWNGEFKKSQWKIGVARVPIQTNLVDCGVYTCLFAAFASNRMKIEFQPSHVPIARKRIAWSICHKRL